MIKNGKLGIYGYPRENADSFKLLGRKPQASNGKRPKRPKQPGQRRLGTCERPRCQPPRW